MPTEFTTKQTTSDIDIDNDNEVIGQLYPDGRKSGLGIGFDIIKARFVHGILIADTNDKRRIVCSPSSPWTFVSEPGKQNEVDFN